MLAFHRQQISIPRGMVRDQNPEGNDNQMMWVGKMNNLIACAEEIVVREVVYV